MKKVLVGNFGLIHTDEKEYVSYDQKKTKNMIMWILLFCSVTDLDPFILTVILFS
jgi:hypothetical protein